MNYLILIWAIFCIIFAFLAIQSFKQAIKQIKHFEVTPRPQAKNCTVNVQGLEIDRPLEDFVTSLNTYIDKYNATSKAQNIIAGYGYIAAAAVSLVSLLIEIFC